MELPDSVLQEIRARVAGGFESHESLFLRIFESMGDELALPESVSRIEEMAPETSDRLRAAIAAAFSEKMEEMRSWPPVTDCDRLQAAFAALARQGIVALENCGFTQQDGRLQAAHVAVVRDELGPGTNDGYCIFHDQDLMHAVEGDGLWLAFGSFEEDAADSSRRVGEQVAEACRHHGLGVEWNGSPDTRIKLPRLRWQRRLVVSQESDVQEFFDGWELEIRAGYTPIDALWGALDERAGDWFAPCADFGPELLTRLRAHTERFLEAEQARERTWSEPTVNDRITAAFEELRARRIHASECLGLTIQDGWGYAGLEASEDARGVVFFHREDVIDCMDGLGLYLAFGAIGVDPSKDDAASHALAGEVMSVLEAHGVACSWNHTLRERIHLSPFEWRRRRWTAAPPHERRQARPPRRPSVWAQIFRRARAEARTSSADLPARQLATVVRAVRDERGFALRRARQMRSAWKALGNSGQVQVGHLGVPHVFVRAGEFTTMKPQLAAENIREEKNEIFLSAARKPLPGVGTPGSHR